MNKKTSSKDFGLSSNEKLFNSIGSPFKPKKYINIIPKGLKLYSFHTGFKQKYKDLLILIFDNIASVKCVYSLTSTPSAPIIWDKKYNKGNCKALIINSGNANAHTGKQGLNIIDKYVSTLIKKLKIKKNHVLVSSTGVIGELFDPRLIIQAIKKIDKSKQADLLISAKTIMTTDTYPKTFLKKIKIDNKIINIFGFAKGSGMIQPNMGTMLAYIFIDCSIDKSNLNNLMKDNLDNTFNSISVDSDTSTSDTLMLFALPNKSIKINNKKNYSLLSNALFDVMKNLSLSIIKDGEGISKLIQVDVINALSKKQAKNVAFSIINSPLVKTAIAGQDANWGRIIMAIGKTSENINQNKIKLFIGGYLVSIKGSVFNKINNIKINSHMKKKHIKIKVDLNNGKFSKTVFGNDLTYQYIRINADYRS